MMQIKFLKVNKAIRIKYIAQSPRRRTSKSVLGEKKTGSSVGQKQMEKIKSSF